MPTPYQTSSSHPEKHLPTFTIHTKLLNLFIEVTSVPLSYLTKGKGRNAKGQVVVSRVNDSNEDQRSNTPSMIVLADDISICLCVAGPLSADG